MNEQLSLFNSPEPNVSSYNLILAIFPDTHTAERIGALGNSIRERYGMYGKVRPTKHLHVSLPFPCNPRIKPETTIENIDAVCGSAASIARPFDIRLDRVMSFRGRSRNHPVVLRNADQESEGITSLHRLLCVEFAKLGSSTLKAPKFVPHLTLLYDEQELAPQSVDPVCWIVKEIALVLSEVGATKYHWLKSWPLAE